MEGLDLENILDDNQMDLLFGNDEPSEEETDETKENKEKENKEQTTEVDPDRMFADKPESVGSEDNEGDEEDTASNEDGSSPDFFSSIANAFAEEGIFPDLDEETIKNIKTPQDFRNAIDEQIKASLDEQQKRVIEALDNNVAPDKVKWCENMLSALGNITDEQLQSEDEDGEKLRGNLIYQDYLNKGFSKERAEKETKKSFDDGTDVEDAKDALKDYIAYIKNGYKMAVEEGKKAKKEEEKKVKERLDKVKQNIFDEKNKFFGDMSITDKMRNQAYDAITKPVWRDPDTGEYLTAMQKYEKENNEDYIAKIGLIYVLTDGFKSFDGLVKSKVRKEVKRGFSELESKINNSSRDSNGNLRFTSGVSDSNSYFGKGMKLDL